MCVGVFVNVVGFYSLLIVFTALPTNITKNGCKNNNEQKGPVAANITKKWTTLSWQTWAIHMWVNKLPTHRGLKCMANERIKSAKKKSACELINHINKQRSFDMYYVCCWSCWHFPFLPSPCVTFGAVAFYYPQRILVHGERPKATERWSRMGQLFVLLLHQKEEGHHVWRWSV